MDERPAHLRPVPAPSSEATARELDELPADVTAGLTKPLGRGNSTMFLTDVVVELGYSTRERVEAVIEEARIAGRSADEMLIEQRLVDGDQISRAVAERYGLDHIDLSAYHVEDARIGCGRKKLTVFFSDIVGFVNETEGIEPEDYTIIGKQVNLANRLQAAAQAGEILIGQETWLLVRDVFRCVAKKPVQAKGFERPIQTYAVMGPELSEDPAIIEEARPGFRLTLDPAQVKSSERLAVVEKLRAAIARLG